MFFSILTRFNILVFIVLSLLLPGCENGPHPAENREGPTLEPVAVAIAKVTLQRAANQMEVVGTVQSVDRAEISAKVTGNITALPVNLGSRVNFGDTLVEIQADEISARLQQAKAQLQQARRNLAREEKLLKKNAATPENVKSLKDTLLISRAGYREAETMLAYTTITAPFSGIVTRKLANTGDLARPAKVLLHLERENKLQIATDIPEAMIDKIQKGDRLAAYIPAAGARVLGTVTELSPTADPSSRTSPVKLSIPSGTRIRLGQFARVTLDMEETNTLVIPASALFPYGQMERVFVVQEEKAILRLVRTGAKTTSESGERFVEILSGLNEGEEVVTTSNQNLENGHPLIIE